MDSHIIQKKNGLVLSNKVVKEREKKTDSHCKNKLLQKNAANLNKILLEDCKQPKINFQFVEETTMTLTNFKNAIPKIIEEHFSE